VNNELKSMWDEAATFKVLSQNFPGWRKTTKCFSKDIRCPGRDSNQALPNTSQERCQLTRFEFCVNMIGWNTDGLFQKCSRFAATNQYPRARTASRRLPVRISPSHSCFTIQREYNEMKQLIDFNPPFCSGRGRGNALTRRTRQKSLWFISSRVHIPQQKHKRWSNFLFI
jgi:hypothetical protein